VAMTGTIVRRVSKVRRSSAYPSGLAAGCREPSITRLWSFELFSPLASVNARNGGYGVGRQTRLLSLRFRIPHAWRCPCAVFERDTGVRGDAPAASGAPSSNRWRRRNSAHPSRQLQCDPNRVLPILKPAARPCDAVSTARLRSPWAPCKWDHHYPSFRCWSGRNAAAR
jgi:hypothetical protein